MSRTTQPNTVHILQLTIRERVKFRAKYFNWTGNGYKLANFFGERVKRFIINQLAANLLWPASNEKAKQTQDDCQPPEVIYPLAAKRTTKDPVPLPLRLPLAFGEVLTFSNLCVSLLNFATCRIFSNNNNSREASGTLGTSPAKRSTHTHTHTVGAIYWPNTSARALYK